MTVSGYLRVAYWNNFSETSEGETSGVSAGALARHWEANLSNSWQRSMLACFPK